MIGPISARSPSAMALVAMATLVAMEGLAAARIGFAAPAFQTAVLTLAAGWILAGSGLAAWHLAPASRTGTLLVAAGASSLMASFGHVGWEFAAVVATWTTWVYVALLGQVLLTQPDGHAGSTTVTALVVGFYIVALTSPPDEPLRLAAGLGLALAIRRAVAGPDARRGSADAVGLLVAAALAAGPLLDVLAPSFTLNVVALWLATVASTGVLLAGDTIRLAPVRGRVTDIVLRLDARAPISVAGELRWATGDPTLELGFRRADDEGFVDAAGRPIRLPDPGAPRVATVLGPEEHPTAVMVHDRRLGTDAALAAATAQAVALESANARLQAELRDQLHDVHASRRRLLIVGDEERRALEQRLAGVVLPDLDELGVLLDHLAVDREGAGDPTIDRARRDLIDVHQELACLADGLHARALDTGGLAGALEQLAGRSRIPVLVTVDELPPLPSVIDTSAWFVCSEALANVAKHAAATRAWVSITVHGDHIELQIADDGRGGADPEAGTGLIGLRDRVEALGGTLRVESAPGCGTRLLALLPVTAPGHAASAA